MGHGGEVRGNPASSLPTPPCSEDVHWLILTEPVQLSADQIEAFTTAHTGDDRPRSR